MVTDAQESSQGSTTILRQLILLIAILLVITTRANGQSGSSPDRGFKPTGSYSISDIESINLENGNLSLNVPLASLPPGRGSLTGGVSLIYNSKLWDAKCAGDTLAPNGQPITLTGLNLNQDGGWRYGIDFSLRLLYKFDTSCGSPECSLDRGANAQWKLQVIFPDGSQHEMRLAGQPEVDGYTDVRPDGKMSRDCGIVDFLTGKLTYHSVDRTFLRLDVEHDNDLNWTNNPWTLYFPDGRRVTGGNAPQRIYDRNGNFIEIQNITFNSHPATRLVDQLNRSVTIEFDTDQDLIHVSGVNNEPLTWTVRWKSIRVLKAYAPVRLPSDFGGLLTLDQTIRVVDQIIAPAAAGSRVYAFGYNATANNPFPSFGWGELNSITLATGASVNYTHAQDGLSGAIEWETVLYNHVTQKNLSYMLEYDGTVTPSVETWSYSIRIPQPSGDGLRSEVFGPGGSFIREDFEDATFGGTPVTLRSETLDAVVERIWLENISAGYTNTSGKTNRYVKTEFRSLKNSAGNPISTAIRDFSYDKNGNVTRVTDYDWVTFNSIPRDSFGRPTGIPAGAVAKRTTINTYYSPTPDASDSTTDDPDIYYHSTSLRLRNAVESTELRNQAGQPVSRTEVFYDSNTTTGNVTQRRSWDSTRGGVTRPLSSSNSISESHQYDGFGNCTLSTDARGVQTQFVYGVINGFSGLYPTEIRTALNTSVQRTVTQNFDFFTGVVTSITDTDNGTTTRTSYDVLGRPTLVQEAYQTSIERRTLTEYSDTLRRVIRRSDLSMTGDGKLVTVEHYDQLGRIRLSRRLENAATESAIDETTGIKIQTRYRKGGGSSFEVVSNPYRAATSSAAGSEQTMGWTRTRSDGAGRVVDVETFSGAGLPAPWGFNGSSSGRVSSTYDAEFSITTDPAGKIRRSLIDSCGRLVRVDEPDANNNLDAASSPVTSYSYDARDNLVSVTQGPQRRFFMYDSLSRLIRVRYPEHDNNLSLALTDPITGNGQWSMVYTHDNNSNVKSRIDSRGVITTYEYDELNRLRTRRYQGPAPGGATPEVTYNYDAPGVPNSRGRLTSVTSTVSSSSYGSYDALGRVLSSIQTTAGQNYMMSYKYDLAGNMTEETYPTGLKMVMTYDSASRASSVTGQKTGEPDQTYLSQIKYASHGAVTEMKLGNNLWEHTTYNSRLQPDIIGLGIANTSSGILELDYDYGTTTNNGNVLSQKITVPGLSQSLVQAYAYDSLNRLQEARENQGSTGGTETWKQRFVYDRFGNRNFDQAATTLMGLDPITSQTTNRIVDSQNYSYDPAGNLTQMPGGATPNTMSYDGENRQITHINGSSGATTSYEYDGDGRRVKRISGGVTTVFVYNALGLLIAEYDNSPLPPPAGGTSYLTTDHLGSTRIITGEDQSVKARHDYLPFGEEIQNGVGGRTPALGYVADTLRQKFTSYERDTESGLDFAQARYYSSLAGRFTSVDPSMASGRTVAPQSWNRYSYTINNPLKYTDPTGLDWWYDPNSEHPIPMYSATDPGGNFKRWTETYGYVFQPYNAGGRWIALNPFAPEYFLTDTREHAAEQFAVWAGKGGLISGTLAQRDWLSGFSEGVSPLGPIAGWLNGASGIDTTSREYLGGLNTGILLAAVLEAGVGAGVELRASSRSVAQAEKAIARGATEVYVNSADEAAEVYLRNYHGDGYRNTTGMTGKEVRNDGHLFPEKKKGTYHWDLHDTQHGGVPHLQVHTHKGETIRIKWKVGK